ncbi:hypothetical protein L2E82_11812 [Cichorium intybus]|nr:hypothetical protein L2E82_11812 [Cichorium intybus]
MLWWKSNPVRLESSRASPNNSFSEGSVGEVGIVSGIPQEHLKIKARLMLWWKSNPVRLESSRASPKNSFSEGSVGEVGIVLGIPQEHLKMKILDLWQDV